MPIWSNWSAEFFRHWMNSPEVFNELPPEGSPEITQKFKGALIGHLNETCTGDENRKRFLAYLFGVDTTKLLTPKQWVALYAFLMPIQNEQDGKWYVWTECPLMAARVIRAQWELVEGAPCPTT